MRDVVPNVGQHIDRFAAAFNQYKSNVNFYNEDVRGLTQEKMILHFFDASHNGSAKDMSVKIVDYCNLPS